MQLDLGNLMPPLGSPGFALPDLAAMEMIEIGTPESLARAREIGIECRVDGDLAGPRARIFHDRALMKRNIRLTIAPRTVNATMVLGNRFGINATITLGGSNTTYIDMGSDYKTSGGAIHLMSDDGLFYFGREATAGNFVTTCKGQGNALIIGEDCMFANEVMINPTDFHAVFDLETGKVLNEETTPVRPVILHPHVWLGSRVMVMKGKTIGMGSAVAAASIVTKDLPAHVVAAGNPARVVREGASWSRALRPSERDIADLKHRFAGWSA